MSSTCTFVESDFLNKSERLQNIGEGTFGSVSLYNTSRGRFVVKETKMSHKSLGYPPDFLTEIDMLIKFRPIRTVVSIEGVCFDLEKKKGFILLEPLDTNLSTWARSTLFAERMRYIPDLIDMIAGTLALMHRFSFIHNDVKTNNILVKNTATGPLFKLADFGKSIYVIDTSVPYGGIGKYSPPKHRNVYVTEYWAFMVSLIEVIIGGRRMVTSDDSRDFYSIYTKRGKFDLFKYLQTILSPMQFASIPNVFWRFVQPLLTRSSPSISEGLSNINISISSKALKDVEDNISRVVPEQPGFKVIKQEFYDRIKKVGCIHNFYRFENIMNKFLHLSPLSLSEINLKHYAEVVYIIVVKSRAQHFRYFDDQDTFLLFERALLTLIGFQTTML